jgi:glycosyltransferase involved in cell wall biosynthesis
MKVLVCAGFAESLVLFRASLLSALVQLKHSVAACAPGENKRVEGELRALGVRYLPYRLKRTALSPVSDLFSTLNLYRLFREERPDLLLSYTVKPVIYGSFAASYAGVPRIFSLITGLGYAFTEPSVSRRFVGLGIRWLYRHSLATNETVYFQNPDDLALMHKLGVLSPAHPTVVVNGSGIDLEQFPQVPLPKGKVVFLLIARLLKDKGICEFVEAARRMKRRYSHVHFRLVGPSDTNPAAIPAKLLQAWEQEGIVECKGWVHDVRPEISKSTVYVLPSYREGTPRTVLEAMAMGRPIITTDAAGCRETVRDGRNGFLVPVRDVGKLADAMERFIIRPELALEMGICSRKFAEEKYDVHKVNAAILGPMGLLVPGLLPTGAGASR